MNYIPLVLGLLLCIAGSISIISGYDIVTIERGWTEVIAGTTALTGGVIALSLWVVLRQLSALAKLYQGPSIAEHALDIFDVAAAPPADFGFAHPANVAAETPLTSALNPTPPLDTPKSFHFPIRVKSPEIATSDAISAADSKLDQAVADAALLDEEIEAAARSATNRPANRFAFKAKDHPIRPRPNLFRDKKAEASAEPVISEAKAPAVIEPAPTPADEKNSPSLPSVPSLDDIWQRVAEEIEKPILSEANLSAAPREKHFETSEVKPEEAASSVFERASENAPQDAEPESAPQAEAATAHPDDVIVTDAEPHVTQDIPASPSVIGSYEADGTTYVMFADGSIDARSEAGVYHFTSMAHLKAYIEDKQATPAET